MDLMAAEYRAFRLAADLARTQDRREAAKGYDLRALAIQRFIEAKAWNAEKRHFSGFAGSGQSFFGDGDAFILYFSATKDPSKIQGALAAIKEKLKTSTPGIEEQSYLPEILYRYGAAEEAYSQILDLSRPNRERREYPEVSYSIIGAIVTGMMGIDVTLQHSSGHTHVGRTVISTLPQLSGKTSSVELDHLPVRNNVINLRHEGNGSSTLTNVSGPALLWQPRFPGRSHHLMVDGRRVAASTTSDRQHRVMTTTSILIQPNSRMVVKMVDPIPAPVSVVQ